jgi:tetratricopeptide (TPR) repeat protein
MGKVEERVRVVVVSPGDVARERMVAQAVVDELNRGVAGARGCRLVLWRWEIDARPGMHLDGPQGLVDELMGIRDADVVVGVFWKRFGTPTGDAASGTEHELRCAWAAWRQRGRPEVMVYFCSRGYSPKTPDELAQWQRVLEFQQALPEQQLWWRYTTVAQFERLLREHLTTFVLARGAVPEPRRVSSNQGHAQRQFPLPSALAAGAEDVLVGRAAELEALGDVFAAVAGGSRQLVLLCGEPGIGKTRLATECALRAHANGAIVLHGRCDSEALLALQPFVDALRHYVDACPARELAERLQFGSGELRRMLPELADRIADLPEPLAGDPEGARSRLFEAVSALLCEAAQSTALVLVLEDLHWADTATLLLLKYLIRYPRQARLMVLGTYRDTELDVDHPLSRTLAELGCERLVARRALAPLDAAAVSQLVDAHAGHQASPELHRMVYEATEGNAFFVVEVLRHLAESGAIGDGSTQPSIAAGRLVVPESVRDVIGQRLACLGAETGRLLIMAAVLGRAFELDVLQQLSALHDDELLDALESAVRARVIEEVAGSPGHFMFSHALIRQTLYDGLTATRRARLHRRAAAALERAHAAAIEPYLAQLAYHFARSTDELDKAIEYGARAGEHAFSVAAYEQAAAHFRQAVALIDTSDPTRLSRRCDLVIAQGTAEREAGDHAYRRTLLDGARLAQELGDPDRLARAALANHRGLFNSILGIDRDRVSVLQAALEAYDSSDSPTRAALLSLLAFALVTDPDWRAREKLSDDALTMARHVGHPHTLALVLTQRAVARWRPQTLPELRRDLTEAAQLADRLNDPLLAAHAGHLGAQAAMEAGDLEHADRLLAALGSDVKQLRQPLMRWYNAVARAHRCLISGPAEEAERLAFAALELGRSAHQPDIMLWFYGHLCVARFLQGSLDRGDPHLLDVVKTPGSLLPPISSDIIPNRSLPVMIDAAISVILCEVGRLDDARRHFSALMSHLDELAHDYMALVIAAQASIACARLGDKHSARRLHAILEPHSHRLVGGGSVWWGATTHYLGLLATTLDQYDDADARFDAAERSYITLDAKPWLARLHRDWAAALLTRGRSDDNRRAQQLLERAAAYHPLA